MSPKWLGIREKAPTLGKLYAGRLPVRIEPCRALPFLSLEPQLLLQLLVACGVAVVVLADFMIVFSPQRVVPVVEGPICCCNLSCLVDQSGLVIQGWAEKSGGFPSGGGRVGCGSVGHSHVEWCRFGCPLQDGHLSSGYMAAGWN